jgi:hypothetical protein
MSVADGDGAMAGGQHRLGELAAEAARATTSALPGQFRS